MRHDEYEAMSHVARKDAEADVMDILDYLRDCGDQFGVDQQTLEIVRLRVEARFAGEPTDDDA